MELSLELGCCVPARAGGCYAFAITSSGVLRCSHTDVHHALPVILMRRGLEGKEMDTKPHQSTLRDQSLATEPRSLAPFPTNSSPFRRQRGALQVVGVDRDLGIRGEYAQTVSPATLFPPESK